MKRKQTELLGGILLALLALVDNAAEEATNGRSQEHMLHQGVRTRCQAKRAIRGHQGLINADDRGTIESEIHNLGRHMISVRWDNGLCMYVFPEEITVNDEIEDPCYAS